MPAAANSLQLEWPEPWGCGAPVTGYLVDMARADAVLTVQGPPTPPQVQRLHIRCSLLEKGIPRRVKIGLGDASEIALNPHAADE